MSSEHPILEQVKAIRFQLDSARAKLNELTRLLDGLSLPSPARALCPHCGLALPGRMTLEEHVYVSHSGPLPSSWARADELAGAMTAP